MLLSQILFTLHSECRNNKALEESVDLKIGRKVIRTVKYADDHATGHD